MMKSLLKYLILLQAGLLFSQINYGEPIDEALPEKLDSLRRVILVNNFPQEINPVKIKNRYYWKHTTTILCQESAVKIVEFGAYLLYNGQWNLRQVYDLNELNKNFHTKNQQLKLAEPYTWSNNWRTDSKLYGGWAMWYFIGITANGEKVCGFQKINTTANLLNP